MECMESL